MEYKNKALVGQVDTKRNTDVTDVIERVTELMHEQTQSQEGTKSQKKKYHHP